MDYYIDEFLPKEKKFMVRFVTGEYIPIDFYNDYPNYEEPIALLGAEKWHFTALNDNVNVTKGDVKLFNYSNLRKLNTNINKFIENDILYRKTTQIEYDKYLSKIDSKCDNAKLYYYLLYLYNDKKNKTNEKNKKIKVSIV